MSAGASQIRSAFLFALVLCLTSKANGNLQNKVHHKLTKREIGRIFGAADHSEVPAYEVISPRSVDHNLLPLRRARRSVPTSTPQYFEFEGFGVHFHLNLTKNDKLLAPNHVVEYHNGKDIKRVAEIPHTYSIGQIGDDENTMVAIDHSNGLTGVIRTPENTYVIHPIPKRLQKVRNEAPQHDDHIIFKSSSSKFHSCGVKHDDSKKVPVRKRRAVVSGKYPKKTMELMLVANKGLADYLGLDFTATYLLAVGNIVAGLFIENTLEYKVDVAIIKTVILDHDPFTAATSVSQMLGLFKNWVRSTNPEKDDHPYHADNSALLFKPHFPTTSVAGYAYDAICAGPASSSATRDHGIQSAFVMAHEIGHNLGLLHDGDGDNCKPSSFIMSAGSVTSGSYFQWSNCSSVALKNILTSSRSSCFDDKPSTHKTNVSFQLYGQLYDGDKQCQLMFGMKYRYCSYYAHRCDKLHCMIPGEYKCTIAALPVAQGTKCGPHKWCIYDKCVPDGTTPPPPINGGWSAWGDYGGCTSKCGGGLQFKTRTCTNPPPQNGGKKCQGDDKGFWKTCNMQACPAGTKSLRQLACEAKNPDFQVTYHDPDPCKLICGTSEKAHWHGNVPDGDKCYNDPKRNHLCIRGVCRQVGCDLQLESGMIEDRCLVCGGDGSTCERIEKFNSGSFSQPGSQSKVCSIPKGSFNVKVEEGSASFNFLDVKFKGETTYLYRVPAWSNWYEYKGTRLRHVMEKYIFADRLEIPRQVTEDFDVYVLVFYTNQVTNGVKYRYHQSIQSTGEKIPTEWVLGQWSQCSKTCAGGTHKRSLACRRKDDLSYVSTRHCSQSEKPAETEACQTGPCPAAWYISDWTKCSKSCGNGTRTRTLTCSQLHKDGKYYLAGDSSTCSSAAKPSYHLHEYCNAIDCPAAYVEGALTKCSTTCGPGTRTREVTCQRINADGSQVKVRELECSKLIKPNYIINCNQDTSCAVWKEKYEECSKTCGGGVHKAIVICILPGPETRVDDSQCKGTKPAVTLPDKPCNGQACTKYEWLMKEGTCTVTCGIGIIVTKPICFDTPSMAKVEDSKCDASKKPSSVTKPCDAGRCPETYEWRTKYGSCSVTCGPGTSKFVVECYEKSANKKVNDAYCTLSLKPSGQDKSCNLGTCPPKYSWNVTYSSCSVTCGTGTKTAKVTCMEEISKKVADDSKCTATKPTPAAISCNEGECPLKHKWQISYGKCSATCDEGVQNPIFTCTRIVDGEKEDNSLCKDIAKPPAQPKKCNLGVCPVIDFKWELDNGPCVVPCGSGNRVTLVVCRQLSTKSLVDASHCEKAGLTKPTQVACTTAPCVPDFKLGGVPVYGLGCYRDNPVDRKLPKNIGNFRNAIDWTDMSKTVQACAKKAQESGYEYFALQYYGECWAGGKTVMSKYYEDGTSTNCYQKTGGQNTNYVYHFEVPYYTRELPYIKNLGCYADKIGEKRPLPILLAAFRTDINDWDKFKTIIAKCAQVAHERNLKIFGVQYYGECWGGDDKGESYKQDGVSTNCVGGVGKEGANQVYQFA